MPKVDKKKQIHEEIEKHRKEVMANASACLGSDLFKKYRKSYEQAEKKLIDQFLEYHEPDPIKYAFEISILRTTLKNARSLLQSVERNHDLK